MPLFLFIYFFYLRSQIVQNTKKKKQVIQIKHQNSKVFLYEQDYTIRYFYDVAKLWLMFGDV